jgi:hypothetical protein
MLMFPPPPSLRFLDPVLRFRFGMTRVRCHGPAAGVRGAGA